MLVVPSASIADAEIPTVVPVAEVSITVFMAVSMSVTALTSNSSKSVTAIETVCDADVLVPSDTVTLIERDVAVSKSSFEPSATLSSPVPASSTNAPSAFPAVIVQLENAVPESPSEAASVPSAVPLLTASLALNDCPAAITGALLLTSVTPMVTVRITDVFVPSETVTPSV